MDNRFGMYFFGCDQRKSRCQIETHLIAKYTYSTRTSTVSFTSSVVEDMLEKIVVLLQGLWLIRVFF